MKRTITSALALILTTVLVAACGSDESTGSVTTAAATTAAAPATSEAATATEAAATTSAEPEALTIQIVGEQPVGGGAKLKLKKGDQIRFTVDSDTKQEVHLHGYDIAKVAAPGAPAEFDLEATIDGVFEAELEDPGVQILKLTVVP